MKKLLLFLLLFIVKAHSQEKITVYFDLDIPQINTDSSQKLADWISRNKGAEIIKIHGFCDSVASSAYNDRLASRRIESVLEVLKKNKIAISENIEQKAFGERFEQAAVQSENRKVEIYYRVREAIKLSEQIVQMQVGEKLRLRNLNFYNRSGRVVPKSIPVLEELFTILRDNPKLKIAIQGHICCQLKGDLENISTLRSKTVYDYLLLKGIAKSRLSYKGYGNTMPLYPIPEKNEFERDENRRVEIMIVENQ